MPARAFPGYNGGLMSGVRRSSSTRERVASMVDALLESRPAKLLLATLIVISVLPYPAFDDLLRPVYLTVFGVEFMCRAALLAMGHTPRTRPEFAFLAIDAGALVSFLPLEHWLSPEWRFAARFLRLARLLALLRFFRGLAINVYRVLTRREQLQQLGLITLAVSVLSFGSAVVLTNLDILHDYNGTARPDDFWDRMWWAFRQVESPDNLVRSVRGHPLLVGTSLALTIVGIFVFSYLIGIAANVVDQVVRAERRRPVVYQGHTLIMGAIQRSELLVREFVRMYFKNREHRRFRLHEVAAWLRSGGPRPRRGALPRMALLGKGQQPPGYLFDPGMRWVVYREGDPSDLHALNRVAAADAKRAVIIADRDAGDDADAITVARLGALRAQNRAAHVFVEVVRGETDRVVHAVGGEGTFSLNMSRFLGLLLCHHLIVPRMEDLLKELLTAQGSEFYTHVFVDPAEHRALARVEHPAASFRELARQAYAEHGLILAGVLLGPEPVHLQPAALIPVDRLATWVNPLGEPQPDGEALGAKRGEVPLANLRGIIGIADSYGPLRRFGSSLMTRSRSSMKPSEYSPSEHPASAHAAALVDRIRVPKRALRRVLIVGQSPALSSLVDGLARFVPEIDVHVVLRENKHLPRVLRDLGLQPHASHNLREPQGCSRELERGGRLTVRTTQERGLAQFTASCLSPAQTPDAMVFLADPDAVDVDARTVMEVLQFADVAGDTLSAQDAEPAAGGLRQFLVEIRAISRGAQLDEKVAAIMRAKHCAPVRVTLVSTDQIRNYFMVHSAFVPGVTAIYEQLLGARGQELVRLPVAPTSSDEPAASVTLTLAEIADALVDRECVPIAIELADQVVIRPSPQQTFDTASIRAIFAIGESDTLSDVFPATVFPETS